MILLVSGLQLHWPQTAAGAPTITIFDAPGAGTNQYQGTFPNAINTAGAVAGYYLDLNNVPHGFLRAGNRKFPNFDPQGFLVSAAPQGSKALSINTAGAITGYYYDANSIIHCFLRAPNGTFTNVDPPGSIGSTEAAPSGEAPIVINTAGAIAGNYSDGIGLHGFLRAPDGTFTTFDPPASPTYGSQTFPMAINPAGAIAGSYMDGNTGSYRGFLRAPDGTVTAFDPSGSLLTQVEGINQAGQITGWYFPNFYTGPVHGFLRRPKYGSITSIDPPPPLPPLGVFPYAINPAGTITGNYFANNQYHGFLLQLNGTFTTFDPPGSQNTTTPTAINKAGAITGSYPDANSVNHGFLRSAPFGLLP